MVESLTEVVYEPPSNAQKFELLSAAIHTSLIANPSTVSLIRKNARPIMIESASLPEDEIIQELSRTYKIPGHIIAEILSNAQMTGFLAGTSKEVSEETMKAKVHQSQDELISLLIEPYVAASSTITKVELTALDSFFKRLAQTGLIKSLMQNNIQKDKMPRGIIRQISLFDMDYKNSFSSLGDRLEFMIINIIEQDKILDTDYSTLIQENGGIPVDHIIGKETTMLSKEKYFGKISTLDFKEQKIDALMRVIPGFSPVGLDFMAGLDLPGSNQNYFSTVGVYFTEKEGVTIPLIHTIQLSTHNIGSDINGDLIGIKEPYDTNTVSMEQRMRIISSFTESVYDIPKLKEDLRQQTISGLPIEALSCCDGKLREAITDKIIERNGSFTIRGSGNEKAKIFDRIISSIIDNILTDGVMPLLIATIDYLFSRGYPSVIIQNGTKNLRLQKHTQDRNAKSVSSSGDNLYTKKAMKLGGKIDDNEDYIIDSKSYFEAMGNSLYGHPYLNTELLSGAINNVFDIGHTARTSSFDITKKTDLELFNTFIHSPTYTNAL